MGLDFVELVMTVEERFGIEIADQEAQVIRTPRLFCDVIEKKLRTVPDEACMTQRAFYLLRRAFRDDFSVSRKMFRPETQLEILVPRRGRQKSWQQLKEHVGALVWPKLRFPRIVSVSIALILLMVGLSAYIWAGPGNTSQRSVLVALALSLSCLIIYPLATPLRTSFAGQTVGMLAEYVVTSNSFLFGPVADKWTRDRIRVELRKIVVDQLGVSPDFSDDADFVDDFKID